MEIVDATIAVRRIAKEIAIRISAEIRTAESVEVVLRGINRFGGNCLDRATENVEAGLFDRIAI